MSDWEGGLPPASPIAVPTRARNSDTKFTAIPHNAVIALQTVTAAASTFLRLDRSAKHGPQNPLDHLVLLARDEEGYRALLDGSFAHVETSIVSGLLRIPYTHVIVTAATP